MFQVDYGYLRYRKFVLRTKATLYNQDILVQRKHGDLHGAN